MSDSIGSTGPLATGTHTVEIDGITQSYHVYGTGPVCIAHSGGPGIFWEYLRMPALEEHLTVVYPEPIGTGASGRLPSHPNGYTRARYSRFLSALIEHLGVPRVHLLGHSHGGFVAQYHALHHPDRIAGVILYDSAPVTGPEHGAEAMRKVQEFAARHADNPDLPEVIGAFQNIPTISDDTQMTAVARGIFPAYFADFWGREAEFGPARAAVTATHISGLDADLAPDVIDDRADLGSLTVLSPRRRRPVRRHLRGALGRGTPPAHPRFGVGDPGEQRALRAPGGTGGLREGRDGVHRDPTAPGGTAA